MRLTLMLLGLVASALAVTTPVVPKFGDEDTTYEKCPTRCLNYATINPGYVQPCLASCNINLGKRIEETLTRMAMLKDPGTPDDFKMLYRDGVMLQNQLVSLKKAVQQQQAPPPNFISAFFPNLGFPQNTGIVPTPFAAPAAPQYPGILMQFAETITSLLNQVIKRQQEILQMIIGCNCSETTEAPTTAAPAVTTAAPPPAKVGVYDVPVVPVKVPDVVTPLEPVVPVVPVKVPEVVKPVPVMKK